MKWKDFNENTESAFGKWYLETDIECPKCGKHLYLDRMTVLTSIPPQYQYICCGCHWSGTSYNRWGRKDDLD